MSMQTPGNVPAFSLPGNPKYINENKAKATAFVRLSLVLCAVNQVWTRRGPNSV